MTPIHIRDQPAQQRRSATRVGDGTLPVGESQDSAGRVTAACDEHVEDRPQHQKSQNEQQGLDKQQQQEAIGTWEDEGGATTAPGQLDRAKARTQPRQ